MRRIISSNSFVISLLLNIFLNIDGVIPAVILLILHFVFDWSILWFWAALVVWFLWILISMIILSFVSGVVDGNTVERENKNPYSVGAKDTFEISPDDCIEVRENKTGDDENV